jgi:hypothetical protein
VFSIGARARGSLEYADVSIQNRGSDNIYVHFGEENATSSNGVLVASGVLYEPVFPGRGTITVIADASVNCVVTEG